jgi:hypothetical protein
MYTPNYGLPMLYQNQSMKEIVVNESFYKLDYIINRVVLDFIDEIPDEPFDGDTYILKNSKIAIYFNSRWEEITPKRNMLFYVLSEKKFAVYTDRWELQN